MSPPSMLPMVVTYTRQGWALGWSWVGYLQSTVVAGFTFSGTQY